MQKDTRNEMSLNVTLNGKTIGLPVTLDLTDDIAIQRITLHDAIEKVLEKANTIASVEPENIPANLVFIGKNRANGKLMYMHKEIQRMYVIEELPTLDEQVNKMFEAASENTIEHPIHEKNDIKEPAIDLRKDLIENVEYRVFRGMTFILQDNITGFNVYIHNITRKFYQDEYETLREIENPTNTMIDMANVVSPIIKKSGFGIDMPEELKNRLRN